MKTGLDKILRGSVQKKILLLVFLCVLPSLAVIVNSGFEHLERSQRRSVGEAFALADKAADVQQSVTESVYILLSTLADLPASVRQDPAVIAGILGKALARDSDLSNIILTDARGSIVAAARPTPPAQSQALQLPGELSLPGGFRVGEFMTEGEPPQPVLPFGCPLESGGEVAGTAIAVVKLDRFHEFAEAFKLPRGAVLQIADRRGRILFSSQANSTQAAGERFGDDAMRFFSGDADSGVEIVRQDGKPGVIQAFKRLRLEAELEPYALILASIPTAEAMLQARDILWRDILLVLGAAALALATALVAGRVIIVGKLKRLIDTAGQVERGRLEVRSNLDYLDGEFGSLAQSFDAMAHALTQDIARRQYAEKELETSRDFLGKILNSIADPIFVKDREHRFALVNDAQCALIGKPRDEILGRTDYDFFPREQVDFFWERDNQVFATGEEDHSEEVITDSDGQDRIIITKKTRYTDGNGNPFVVGVIRDVTEVKRSGMELINRTIELDARVKMLDCLFGISHLAQKRGVTLDRILAEAATLLPPMLTYASSAVARIVYQGTQYPDAAFTKPAASVTADIMVRGKCMGFLEAGYLAPKPLNEEGPFSREEVKILRVVGEHLGQIAERSLAEEELRESEERFRRIVETANEGIAVLDPAHRITYVNTIMAEMLGYDRADILGQHITVFQYEPERQEQEDGPPRRRHALDRKRERLFLRKDGTLLCTIASETSVSDREGRHAGSFGMYADITDRKMAEEMLQELNESLEQLVRDRTEDLSRKTADLEVKARQLEDSNRELMRTAEKLEVSRRCAEEATKAKSVFLANMSHEVRTPINAVLGLSDLALRRGASGEVRRFLEMILKSSRDLLALVNDILDFSKLEAGKAKVESIGFDLPKLVRETMVTFEHQAEAKGLYLDVVIDDDVPRFVESDPTKLRAILANLCSNALKFTDEGGVKVLVRFERHITAFEVQDTGVGVPKDKRAFIFKSFRQADESVGRKHGGTGLGLTISRKLARLLGGKLTYLARAGGGSRFILELPLKPGVDREDIYQQRDQELKQAEKLLPMRILLAEDHEMGRELLSSFLGGLGHEVVCAEDGAQTLDKLREADFDLVLMDGRMPVMDGQEAARAIRSGACGPDKAGVPIVAITAQAMGGDREAFLDAGMNDYVTKPVDLDEILLVLSRYAPAKVRSGHSSKDDAGPIEHGEGEKNSSASADVPNIDSAPPKGASEPAAGEHSQEARSADSQAPVARPELEEAAVGAAAGESAALASLLDRDGALARLKGMTVLLEAMEATFRRTTPDDLEALAGAARASDAANVKLYAHRIKGNAAGVGALALCEAAKGMEAASAGGVVPTQSDVESLEELFRRTEEQMRRVGNSAGTSPQSRGHGPAVP